MLKAFSALSCSTCLIPFTDRSGKLMMPVLISSRLHSIMVSNTLIGWSSPMPRSALICSAHCLLFIQSSAHFLSNLSIYSNHWSVLFFLAQQSKILYCQNCSSMMQAPTPSLQFSISKAQQLFFRMHSLSKQDLHSMVWQTTFRFTLYAICLQQDRKFRKKIQFCLPEAERKRVIMLLLCWASSKFTFTLGLVRFANLAKSSGLMNKVVILTFLPVPSSERITLPSAYQTSREPMMMPWAPRFCACCAFFGNEQSPSLTTMQVGVQNCFRFDSQGPPHSEQLVAKSEKLMGLLQ